MRYYCATALQPPGEKSVTHTSTMRTDAPNALRIRDATESDMEAVQAIHAHHVLAGAATFEETPPGAREMRARRAAVLAAGLPYFAAELHGEIVGHSYATSYRACWAHRHTLEDSVYVKGSR